ncbi:UNVERIFIED_CONTAM: hypothetical protein RMT77_016997 [Armadillidium vulgare]
MKYLSLVVLLFFLISLAFSLPRNVFRIDNDVFRMEQDIDDDDSGIITGSYSWTSPNGKEFFIRYIADDDGFRVLDSNAIPVSPHGVKADGSQGSFLDFSDEDDDDDFDDK